MGFRFGFWATSTRAFQAAWAFLLVGILLSSIWGGVVGGGLFYGGVGGGIKGGWFFCCGLLWVGFLVGGFLGGWGGGGFSAVVGLGCVCGGVEGVGGAFCLVAYFAVGYRLPFFWLSW